MQLSCTLRWYELSEFLLVQHYVEILNTDTICVSGQYDLRIFVFSEDIKKLPKFNKRIIEMTFKGIRDK